MLCCCWNGNLKGKKQEKGLEGHGLRTCCNGHRKRCIILDMEKGIMPNFLMEDGSIAPKEKTCYLAILTNYVCNNNNNNNVSFRCISRKLDV